MALDSRQPGQDDTPVGGLLQYGLCSACGPGIDAGQASFLLYSRYYSSKIAIARRACPTFIYSSQSIHILGKCIFNILIGSIRVFMHDLPSLCCSGRYSRWRLSLPSFRRCRSSSGILLHRVKLGLQPLYLSFLFGDFSFKLRPSSIRLVEPLYPVAGRIKVFVRTSTGFWSSTGVRFALRSDVFP